MSKQITDRAATSGAELSGAASTPAAATLALRWAFIFLTTISVVGKSQLSHWRQMNESNMFGKISRWTDTFYGGGVKEKVLLHSFVQKSDSLHCRLLRDCWMRVKNNPLQNKTSAGAGFVSYPVMNAALH